jgi:hypothetical protein
VPPGDAAELATRWRAEVTGTVAAHSDDLAAAVKSTDAVGDGAVQTVLRTMLMGILQRSFAAAGDAAASASASANRPGAIPR